MPQSLVRSVIPLSFVVQLRIERFVTLCLCTFQPWEKTHKTHLPSPFWGPDHLLLCPSLQMRNEFTWLPICWFLIWPSQSLWCVSLSTDSVNQDFPKYYDPLRNLAYKNGTLLKMVLVSGSLVLLWAVELSSYFVLTCCAGRVTLRPTSLPYSKSLRTVQLEVWEAVHSV